MSQQGEAEEIAPKKGFISSPAWQHFGFYKSDKTQTTVVCKICREVVRTKSGNTTNLFYHLNRSHPQEYELCRAVRGSTSSAGFSGAAASTKTKQVQTKLGFGSSEKYDKVSKRHKDITHAVACFIARDMLPIATVEKPGFKQLLATLDPRYEVPSRKFFSSTALPDLYNKCRESVQKELFSVCFYAATSDLWSSRTSEPYLSLSIHYINGEWSLISKCLETAYFPDDHTAEVIAKGLAELLESWGLDEHKLVCITTDSGANILKATALNHWTRLQCFGHRLHSAIGE